MNRFSIRTEIVLYCCAFFLAVALRFTGLSVLPLNDMEAKWAMQAHDLAQGMHPLLNSQPAYIHFTGLLFFFFGATNFLARFLPALAGSLLIFLPWLFQKRLKPTAGLILAFFLALDPGMIALSRQAGSLMPALAFAFLAWACWWKGYSRVAGVLAGLALLSGPALWAGLLGLGLTWILRRLMEPGQVTTWERRQDLQTALMASGATILLAGTLFFLSTNGLSAWLSSIPSYLSGWVQPSGVPIGRLLFALLVYQPLAIILGSLAIVRGWRQAKRRYKRLGLWTGAALLLALLYPARQVSDLAWVLVPLWTLAALELSNHINIYPEERREVVGVGLLTSLLLVFSWLNYTSIALDPQSPANITANSIQWGGKLLLGNLPPTRYLLLASVLLLLVISLLLVALGWSARIARLGFVWGLTATLGLYISGVAWGATGLRTSEGWELWQPETRPAQADLLLATVNDFSLWSAKDKPNQEIVIAGLDSPALYWLLRDIPVRNVEGLGSQQTPAMVLTAKQDSLNLSTAYRGQDFTWRQSPSWSLLTIYDWMRWSVFRKLPFESEPVILWVQTDLFPDANPSLP